LSVSSRPRNSIPRARFRLDGLTVEVEPYADETGSWRGRVVAPGADGRWHLGRRAWGAVEAAREAHAAERARHG
jgi:hypothetical protein